MIRVAVGCDLTFSGVSAREALVKMPGVTVVGEDVSAEQVLDQARHNKLDVALIDLDMTGVGALEVLRRTGRFRGLAIVLVTAHAQRSYPGSLLRLGAVGYLTRQGGPGHLIEAVQAAWCGERYIAPDIANRLSQSLIDERQRSPFEAFTPRQLQVALLLAQGCATNEVARRLHLHTKTVTNHRRQVRVLLGVKDDAAIGELTVEHGLLTPRPFS